MKNPNTNRRLWYAVGGILIVAFLAYGATSFKSNLTPYVSFDEARSGGKVQVAGGLVPDSTRYVEAEERLRFGLVDDQGRTLPVVYAGVKPGNFEEATQIVAVGSWDGRSFHAEQLLVKCPSKYQGVDDDVTEHGEA